MFCLTKHIILVSEGTKQFVVSPRHFGGSSSSSEPRYDVNGERLTVSEIRAVDPKDRTIAHWAVLVDWDLQRTRPYVIVDPFDPGGLLYLSHHEYIIQSRTLGSMNTPFIIVARPGTLKPVPKNTPPSFQKERHSWASDFDRRTWKDFQRLRSWILRYVAAGKNDTVRVNDRNIMALVYMWSRELLHYNNVKNPAARLDQFTDFAEHLQTLIRHNGVDYTIARLKIYLFALYSYVGGNPLKTTHPLGIQVSLRGGLPKWISAPMRQSIRSGSLARVRVWASLFNIYKYLEGTHKGMDLSSIQTPALGESTKDFALFCSSDNGFWSRLRDEMEHLGKPRPRKFSYKSAHGLLISSAGANSSNAMYSIPRDALAWHALPRNVPMEWFKLHGDGEMATLMTSITEETLKRDVLHDLLWKEKIESWDYETVFHPEIWKDLLKKIRLMPFRAGIDREAIAVLIEQAQKVPLSQVKSFLLAKNSRLVKGLQELSCAEFYIEIQRWALGAFVSPRVSVPQPVTGRLHAINEAAGKVRVVAICDYFSQVALRPVHDWLFDILEHIPQDATFDQEGRVNQFAAKGYKNIYSYDLKAATDLIPKELYRDVLAPMMGDETAALWLELLSDRDFHYSVKEDGELLHTRYTRGQPMGAYSSWASLAIVHHAIVQYAAAKAGVRGWFQDYCVLGDDIVIADDDVAEGYLALCSRYKIIVGLHKSLVSNNGLLNFAAQTLIGEENISPASLREELSSNSIERRLEFSRRLDRRWGVASDSNSVGALRRFFTFPQWQNLSSALAGNLESMLLRSATFCLRNPFMEEGFQVGNVLPWLGLLHPELRNIPSDLTQSFLSQFSIKMLDFLKRELKDRLDPIYEFKNLIIDLPDLPYVDIRYHYWTYISTKVVSNRVKQILNPVLDVQEELHQRIMFKALLDPNLSCEEVLERLHMTNMDCLMLPTVEELVELWRRLTRIPRAPRLRLSPVAFHNNKIDVIMSALKGLDTTYVAPGKRAQKFPSGSIKAALNLKENLRAPLEVFAQAAARVFGVNPPIHSLLSRPSPQRLLSSVRRELHAFKKAMVRVAIPIFLVKGVMAVLETIQSGSSATEPNHVAGSLPVTSSDCGAVKHPSPSRE